MNTEILFKFMCLRYKTCGKKLNLGPRVNKTLKEVIEGNFEINVIFSLLLVLV